MKEIKFRAWNKVFRIMISRVLVGNTLTDDPCSTVWCAEKKEWLHFDKFCGDIMQYTGYKDIDGVEIYEGDIVLKHHEYIDEFDTIEDIRCLPTYDLSKSKVISNIYELFKCDICDGGMIPSKIQCHDNRGWIYRWACDCDDNTRKTIAQLIIYNDKNLKNLAS